MEKAGWYLLLITWTTNTPKKKWVAIRVSYRWVSSNKGDLRSRSRPGFQPGCRGLRNNVVRLDLESRGSCTSALHRRFNSVMYSLGKLVILASPSYSIDSVGFSWVNSVVRLQSCWEVSAVRHWQQCAPRDCLYEYRC